MSQTAIRGSKAACHKGFVKHHASEVRAWKPAVLRRHIDGTRLRKIAPGALTMVRICGLLILLFSLSQFWACEQPEQNPEEQKVRLPGEEEVLAKVNGSGISAYDLEQALRDSLGQAALAMIDDKGRKSVLDSLVASRAISQVQEAKLSAQDKAALDKKLSAYREQLLIKLYLAENVPPQPVSQEMIEKYYAGHQESFGAKTIKQYELITSGSPLGDTQRDRLLTALKDADQEKDWAAWSKTLKNSGLRVDYRSGSADPAILTPALRSQLAGLKPGQAASLTFADGVVNLTRIVAEKRIPACPLKDVSASIRKILAPVQLKKAVKQASEEVLAAAQVEYVKK